MFLKEKFKKPKKVRKGLRKKVVKADDLLPLVEENTLLKQQTPGTRNKVDKIETEPTGPIKVSLKDIDFGLDKKESGEEDSSSDEGEVKEEPKEADHDEDEDYIDTGKLNKRREDDEELRKILDEENEELSTMLNKARKRVIVPLVLDIKTEEVDVNENSGGVDFDRFVYMRQTSEIVKSSSSKIRSQNLKLNENFTYSI